MFKQVLTLVTILTIFTGFSPNISTQAAFSSTFPDVKSSDKFYSHIHNLKEYGIVNGYSNGNFGADNTLTRGEMSKFVRNAIFGKDYFNTPCSNFGDNSNQGVFFREIYTLKCEGVVNGFSDGLFHPERSVSRGEATKFVVNGLRKKYKDEGFLKVGANDSEVDTFQDVDSSNSFYDYINTVTAKNLAQGYYSDYFNPNQAITRGEMAELVWNSMQMRNLKENLVSVVPKNLDSTWEATTWDQPFCFFVCTGAKIYTVKNPNNKDDSKLMMIENKNAITTKEHITYLSLSTKYLNRDSSLNEDIKGGIANIEDINIVYLNTDKVRGGGFTSDFQSSMEDKKVVILITASKGNDVLTIMGALPGFSCSKEKTTEQCVNEFRLDANLEAQAQIVAQELINTFAI